MHRSRTLVRFVALGWMSLAVAAPCFGSPANRPRLSTRQSSASAPSVEKVAAQPLLAQTARLQEAMEFLGSPLPAPVRAALKAADSESDDARVTQAVQSALDSLCLAVVHIQPDSQVTVVPGKAKPRLLEQGWQIFLVKVRNDAGATDALRVTSPSALPLAGSPQAEVKDRWLDLQMADNRPLNPTLSGLGLEYRIIQLYSRDAGDFAASLRFQLGRRNAPPAAGNGSSARFQFTAAPSRAVTFRVRDENGKPTTAAFFIRDKWGRVYPSQAKRLAPDFFFHPQVYRADGETVRLPAGTYTVQCQRGPESVPEMKTLTVRSRPVTLTYRVQRWTDPAKRGWISGDHHIHAAGCAHYTNPTEGVLASDMMRQCLGEDLKVGCNLTWGPCFDFQKQFFTGQEDTVSQQPYLLRYDIEVSGFGSHQSGHLCLLRLKDQIYPGGTSKDHWPTLGLNTLRWAKKQGAVCGPAHSAAGLQSSSERLDTPDGPNGLPTYAIPAYNGIGANEYIVDITHDVPGPDGKLVPAVDFISTMDTDRRTELNMWYHTLNCGFRARASGETDFPCITGDRVGRGRVYVKQYGKVSYDDWCEGIRQGRSYVSDGFSHLMDFQAAPAQAAEQVTRLGEKESELRLAQPGTVRLSAVVSARIPDRQEVPIEVIVNGYPVAQQMISADGREQTMQFDVNLTRSSWVALRIFPSSHTNPVFVLVDGKPIRASRRSAEWCLRGVDRCWSQKERFYKPAELEEARQAYAHAREVYKRILAESDAD